MSVGVRIWSQLHVVKPSFISVKLSEPVGGVTGGNDVVTAGVDVAAVDVVTEVVEVVVVRGTVVVVTAAEVEIEDTGVGDSGIKLMLTCSRFWLG